MSDVLRQINGKPVVFRRLRAEEKVLFCKLAYEARRSAILAERNSGEDITAAMADLRPYCGDPALLWRWCWTADGAIHVVKHVHDNFDFDSLPNPFDWGLLAAEICGFDVSKITKDSGDEARPTNPESGTT